MSAQVERATDVRACADGVELAAAAEAAAAAGVCVASAAPRKGGPRARF